MPCYHTLVTQITGQYLSSTTKIMILNLELNTRDKEKMPEIVMEKKEALTCFFFSFFF